MMRRLKYIKDFEFNEETRAQVVLSDTSLIRIIAGSLFDTFTNPQFLAGLQLKYTSSGYSTAADIFAISKIAAPKAVKDWLAIEEVADKPAGTQIQYRLSDGPNQYYWNGAAWVVNSVLWNDFQTICDNVPRFIPDSGQKALGIVANLSTSDPAVTPTLYGIRALGEFDLWTLDDLLFRSIVPLLKSVRCLQDYVAPAIVGADSSAIALGALDLGNGEYDITGCDSIFDLTNDPGRDNNLLLSYNSSTKTATLSAPIPVGHKPFVRFEFAPRVTVQTDIDYIETDELPEILIEGMTAENVRKMMARDAFRHIADGTATLFQDPSVTDYRFNGRILAGSSVTRLRLWEELRNALSKGALYSPGLDESYGLDVMWEYDSTHVPGSDNSRASTFSFVVRNVTSWPTPEEKPLVQRFNLEGTLLN